MTYEEMLDQINNIPMFGEAGGLSNLERYLEILGHPEKKPKVIHVAGTNGKGSVCAYLDFILREAGYKTGLFTSPHLMRINERFRINFEECADELMIRSWEKVREVLEKREEYGLKMLTYFEIMFLMGMLIFSWENPDFCIVETGLGGRLDATVLTNPILCIITSISLDHTALLGDTYAKIAMEKAGIIKEGIPVVYLKENEDASTVICKKAEEKHAKVLQVSYGDITFSKNEKNTIDFSIENRYYKISDVKVRSGADYQTANASVAMTAVHEILPDLDEDVIRKGIYKMQWPGRMEEIAPRIYVDGAHNPGAIEQICRMMEQEVEEMTTDSPYISCKTDSFSWKLLFAVCADKDYNSMVAMLSKIPWKHIYITKIKTARGAGVDAVADCFRQFTEAPITIEHTSKEAFRQASEELTEGEQLLCLGSLYLVGELKEHLLKGKESEDYHD